MKFFKLNKTLLTALALSTMLFACKKEKPTDLATTELSSANKLDNIKMCTAELFFDGITPRAATLKAKQWKPGTTLTVSLGTDKGSTLTVRNKVIQYAKEWEKYANIKFKFVTDDRRATIRVSFDTVNNAGSWSAIGKDANSMLFGPTMNFGWLKDTSTDLVYSNVVLHEFGHVLGLIHEQNHPLVDIPWDKPAVYAFCAEPPNNWSKEKVDINFFAKYTTAQTNYSQYDPTSIMHYPVSNKLTIGDYEVGWNSVLSDIDKTFIATVYPF